MIKTTWKTNTNAADDLIEFMDDFNRLAADIGERVFRRIEDDFLDELRYYPPPPPNSTYQRTFKLRDGWELTFGRDASGFFVAIRNGTSYTKRVVGSLAQARAAAASFQAWMHKGRWPLAFETVEFWWEAFQEEYRAEFNRELAAFGSSNSRRQAFTR